LRYASAQAAAGRQASIDTLTAILRIPDEGEVITDSRIKTKGL